MTAKLSAKQMRQTFEAKLDDDRAPIEFATAAASGEGGAEQSPGEFSSIAYSGGLVPGYTATPRLPHPFAIDLAYTTTARSVKANLDHKGEQRVGHIPDIDNDGKRIAVHGLLSASTPYRDQVRNSAKDGYDWEASGEFAMGGPKFVPAGETAVVNGRTLQGPFYRMTKNRFTQLAFVSQGADEGNEMTVAASAAGAPIMNEFEKFAASLGVDLETCDDSQKANLQQLFDSKQSNGKDKKTDHQSFEAMAEATRNEKARKDEISSMALAAMKENPLYLEQIESMAKLAMESDTSPEKFELELLRNTRSRSGAFTTQLHRESDPTVIEAAICLSTGLPNIEKHYSEQTLNAVDRMGMRSFSLQQLLMQVASHNGYSCRAGERIHNGNIREVLEYCFPPIHARMSGFSTISLPGILGAVANKEILAGYMEEDQTWQEIARVKPVTNFHAVTSYRMLDDLEYEEVGPDGQIKHGTLSEESYTRQAKTYAKMLGISRTDIINDDLGAFDDIRERLGRGAAKKFNNIFWAAFMNNGSFFTSAKTNYTDGATTNLGVDGVGLGLGVLAYRQMKSPTGDGAKRVGVSNGRPTILLVPPELEVNARKLFVSANFNTGGAATAESVPNTNVYQGLYRPVVQDRLSDSAFTGYSATAWFLFGNYLKPMVVSFLNNQRTPTVESTDADFNTLGIQFRGYHDFGADKSEYLAGVKVKGAAA